MSLKEWGGERMRIRSIRLAVITAAALGAMGMLTLNATASGRDEVKKRFTLFEHETNIVSVAQKSTPSVGDLLAISSDLFADRTMAKKVGHVGVTCTTTSITIGTAGEVLCSFTAALEDGQISTTGLIDVAAAITPGGRFSLPVVGGTGRFNHARGQVDFQTLNPTTDFLDTFNLED
jgi:hypothetical protein